MNSSWKNSEEEKKLSKETSSREGSKRWKMHLMISELRSPEEEKKKWSVEKKEWSLKSNGKN